MAHLTWSPHALSISPMKHSILAEANLILSISALSCMLYLSSHFLIISWVLGQSVSFIVIILAHWSVLEQESRENTEVGS